MLDASWTHARHRAAADELAARTHSDLVRLECRVSADVAAARLARRGPTASDATAAVARAMCAAADPWPEAVPVPTSGEIAESLRRATEAWGTRPRLPLAGTATHPAAAP